MKITFAPSALTRFAVGIVGAGVALTANATVITTTSQADITAFQSGATVETFDSISGVTAASITDYNPKDLTGTTALVNKNPALPAFYNSGGASFNDPVGNPGVPIGIAAPGGGINGEKLSGNNVAGPVNVGAPPFNLFEPGAFMEVIFPTGVSKVGLFVAHGSLQLFLKDENNSNILVGDASASGTTGQFIGITRATADVRGVTIIGNGAFTIDDFTYGTTGSTGGGGGGSSVPDAGHGLDLAFAAFFLGVAGWKFRTRKATNG